MLCRAQVMTHADEDGSASNYMQYCAETNLFTLVLALGFYNENLVYTRHVEQPLTDLRCVVFAKAEKVGSNHTRKRVLQLVIR